MVLMSGNHHYHICKSDLFTLDCCLEKISSIRCSCDKQNSSLESNHNKLDHILFCTFVDAGEVLLLEDNAMLSSLQPKEVYNELVFSSDVLFFRTWEWDLRKLPVTSTVGQAQLI